MHLPATESPTPTRVTDAYFVKCDGDVRPQDQIDQGIVNIVVGFAPLRPAEFVIINIEQLASRQTDGISNPPLG